MESPSDESDGAGYLPVQDLLELRGPRRTFEVVHAANFSCQPSTTRRPPKDENYTIPRLASWRANLVGLSQKTNLYFAAYGDKVFVTVPQGLKHSISAAPDLIIDLPRTERSLIVGGYISQQRPHCVNNLKIGNLGKFEILLVACDDGDILVYYTHLLQHEIERLLPNQKKHKTKVKPFLLENVGSSAWGLAIHEKSRLIGVGSNLREVTVFAPAYSRRLSPQEMETVPVLTPQYSNIAYVDASASQLTCWERRVNCKVRYSLGSEGHNIPALDFASDQYGHAQAVLAADINGNLWTISLWDGAQRRLPRLTPIKRTSFHREVMGEEGEEEDEDMWADPHVMMGWGVAFLPLSCFRTEGTPHEALGGPNLPNLTVVKDDRPNIPRCFDITPTIHLIDKANRFHPSHPSAAQNAAELVRLQPYDDDMVPVEENKSSIHDPVQDQRDCHRLYLMHLLDSTKEPLSPRVFTADALPLSPGSDQTWDDTRVRIASILRTYPTHPLVIRWIEAVRARLQRFAGCPDVDAEICDLCDGMEVVSDVSQKIKGDVTAAEREQLTKIFSQTLVADPYAVILRTFNHDIQLLPSRSNQLLSTICRGPLQQHLPPTHQAQLAPFDRLNMLAIIPELSLVIIGSQLGRAALVTLTKVESICEFDMPMMRIDLILPLAAHELASRPLAPLLGLAVGPVPGSRKIWRLLLHYMNHSILSYELSRGAEEELLVV